jgi:hypothetical protein
VSDGDESRVLAAVTNTPRGYQDRHFPLRLPIATFAGYYGFVRAGRPPLPDLGVVGDPLFAYFERLDPHAPAGVSKMATNFSDEQHASRAAAVLGTQIIEAHAETIQLAVQFDHEVAVG